MPDLEGGEGGSSSVGEACEERERGGGKKWKTRTRGGREADARGEADARRKYFSFATTDMTQVITSLNL
jgi:hypothetical protein